MHLAPAGITVAELIDEYCGGMLDGHTLYGYLPGGASGGILPASLAHVPLDFDTLQAYGCFIGSAAVVVLSDKDRAAGAARNLMRFFKDESCGQCTPCRVGTAKALALMAGAAVGRGAAHRAFGRDDGRIDLRPGPGGAEPGPVGPEVLPARAFVNGVRVMTAITRGRSRGAAGRVQAERPHGGRPRRRADHRDRAQERRRHPASLLRRPDPLRRQLPRVHGRDQGRARPRAVVLPLSEGRDGGRDRQRARAQVAADGDRAPARRHAGEALHEAEQGRCMGEAPRSRAAALSGARAAAGRSIASGDRSQSRRLHPVHALRARLPRGAGE